MRAQAARAERRTADRAARVRRALVELVAGQGLRGASMAAVAERARVATGTAYVHYASKDALILAAFREVKADLGRAAMAGVDATALPGARFDRLWHNVYAHLRARPDDARFLLQVESSPLASAAHDAVRHVDDDPLIAAAAAPEMREALVDLPLDVVYDLGLGPAVRLAAADARLDRDQLDMVARACWRAVRRPLRVAASA